MYNSVQKSKMVKGRSNNAILAACIYIACNNESVPRTFKEICAVSNSSKKDIARCFKMIKSEVETNYTSTTPTDLIVIAEYFGKFKIIYFVYLIEPIL